MDEGEVEEVRSVRVPLLRHPGARFLRNVHVRVIRGVSMQPEAQNQLDYYATSTDVIEQQHAAIGYEYEDGDGFYYEEELYPDHPEEYHIEEESVQSVASPSPRHITFIRCRLCSADVTTNLKRRHIHRFHLPHPLYTCSLCPFKSQYHLGNMNAHMKKAHEMQGDVICHKQELEPQMQSLLYSCFADPLVLRSVDKAVIDCLSDLLDAVCAPEEYTEECLPTSPSHSPTVPCGYEERGDIVHYVINAPQQQEEEELPPAPHLRKIVRVHSGKRMAEGRDAFSPPPARRLRVGPARPTCQICGMREVTHQERHVLQHHLKQKVFCCYHCEYANTYAPGALRDHIRARHPGCSPLDYGDHRLVYGSIIRDLAEECFPRL